MSFLVVNWLHAHAHARTHVHVRNRGHAPYLIATQQCIILSCVLSGSTANCPTIIYLLRSNDTSYLLLAELPIYPVNTTYTKPYVAGGYTQLNATVFGDTYKLVKQDVIIR